MEKLHVFNTLSRKKEAFEPITPGFVGIYVCGPTVYGDAHLGHAKSYVAFDVIIRYLRFLDYKVRYVQNITDVGHLTDDADDGEDKLAKQAKIERLEPMEIAEKYTNSYFRDMDALNVLRPDITPRASGHIPEQIEMVKALIENGFAYEVNGNVYFDVSKDPDYGKLSGRNLKDLMSGTRVDSASDKKNPSDFALWKSADESHIMRWNSPWGVGYPGWHLECSAMSTKYLGHSFDIHGGGLENQFPHHECEIAQSECAYNEPFVKYWLHNNMVTLNGQKMGKSLGNAISLHEFFDGSHNLLSRSWAPEIIRFFLLQSHYRSTTDFSEAALEASEAGLKNLHGMLINIEGNDAGTGAAYPVDQFKDRFTAEMNDDFNTAKALAVVFEEVKNLTKLLKENAPQNLDEVKTALRAMVDDVLGIWPDSQESDAGHADKLNAVVNLLIHLRKEARISRDWVKADEIRDELAKLGIQLHDTTDGTTFSITE